MTEVTTILAAENLSLVRGSMNVLHSVDAQLEPGRITAIVGPNGAGKSSLLMALAGLLDPVEGRVTLGGRPIASLASRERARLLGYLPQGGGIAWDVALETMVGLGRMPHRDSRKEPIDAAISALELDHLRGRPVSRLSGGETARALLARVLAGEPRWILADEPLAALDLAHQLTLVSHLKNSAKSGTGISIVLHDLALAMNHADHVIVLDKGKLAADAPPQEALSPDLIARVWGVKVKWIGEPGGRALIAPTG